MSAGAAAAAVVRSLRAEDLEGVVRIDAQHTGRGKPEYWERVFRAFLHPRKGDLRVGLAVDLRAGLAGYLIGEVRAFEFGSEPCGWIFAVGVDRASLRHGVASSLLDEACARFRKAGIARVRTMVKRTDVPVHSFFRSAAFTAGPYVQLEKSLEGVA
jgi:GNAT superfamily N-acetyltransferase